MTHDALGTIPPIADWGEERRRLPPASRPRRPIARLAGVEAQVLVLVAGPAR